MAEEGRGHAPARLADGDGVPGRHPGRAHPRRGTRPGGELVTVARRSFRLAERLPVRACGGARPSPPLSLRRAAEPPWIGPPPAPQGPAEGELGPAALGPALLPGGTGEA